MNYNSTFYGVWDLLSLLSNYNGYKLSYADQNIGILTRKNFEQNFLPSLLPLEEILELQHSVAKGSTASTFDKSLGRNGIMRTNFETRIEEQVCIGEVQGRPAEKCTETISKWEQHQ